MTRHAPATTLLVALALVACGGGSSEAASTETTPPPAEQSHAEATSGDTEAAPPPPAAPPPRIRVVHASSDEAAGSIAVALDSGEPFVTGLSYGNASAYVGVAEGRHSVTVHGGSEDAPSTLGVASDVLESDHAYTVFFVTQGSADAPFALYTGDDDDHPGDDVAGIRFFHAIVGADDVDVCLPGPTTRAPSEPVFADVAPNALGSADALRYADLPAGTEVALQVRAHASPPCHGRAIGVGHFTPEAGVPYTVVAIGRTTGRPRAALQLLVCRDAPSDGSCTAVPLGSR